MSWFQKNFRTLIYVAFLVPIITVAIVSISHVTKWYGISNPLSWSIYLSVGIEIAALSALAAIAAQMGKKVYFPFIIVTLIQFIGNIFFAYQYIDMNSQSFKDWVDMVDPAVQFLGVESGDLIGHKRFLALFAGGMLPIISLSFLHMLVKFEEEEKKKLPTQTLDIDIEKLSTEAGKMEEDPEKYGTFKSKGKQKKKTQIILSHTSREVEQYLTSLKFRYNGSFDRVPNFLITRKGEVLQLIPEIGYTNYLNNDSVNQNSVVISLENLGWLEKKPLSNYYINWIGSIYKGEVYEKKWRDFFFWQPYTQLQVDSLVELCLQLTDSLQIEKRSIGHNTKIDGITKWNGIISRSNIDSKYTDLNPSFNFDTFTKFFENEQQYAE